MASITTEPGGRRTIQFVGRDNKRRSIRLGKVSQRIADAVKTRVEQLNAAQIAGHAVEADTARWLTTIDDRLADKLAAVGLVPKRAEGTLDAFLTGYIASRTDIKSRSVVSLQQVQRNLVDYFGPDKPLREVTPGDTDNFRLHLLKTLGDNTVRRRCGRAKQLFRAALRQRLIPETPFADMKGCEVRANKDRDFFISRETAQKVLDACPDGQWRLLFALSRFGGLRCPSEHLALTWGDVDWEHGRLTIRSPKTEHHEGKDSRSIPLFPELRPYLADAFDRAEPGTEFVITRYRNDNANLRTQLNRILRRAGVRTWPKLFANLRASRATELVAEFPAHVAAAWLGHSTMIAAKHYWQVTDADFAKATAPAAAVTTSGAESGAAVVQNQVQQPAAGLRSTSQESQPEYATLSQCDTLRSVATVCYLSNNSLIAEAGLEPALP